MKKLYLLVCLFIFFIIVVTLIGSSIVTGSISIKEEKDILVLQKNKEVYFDVYGYSIDNPNVIINPYGNSPLTALVMFETSYYSEVDVTIKSKDGSSDINYSFDKDKYHIIPIYGLYADYNNTVIIKSENVEKTLYISTDNLPDDFIYLQDVKNENFIFYNGNYPYAVDTNGEVRWYLNEHYYGNITFLDNSSIVIGSDKYNEYNGTISVYRMNLLGKIYSEYLLPGGYYGYNTLYNDDILVLSDKLLLIDSQTGTVLEEYIPNENFNFLTLDDDDIIVKKNDKFYKVDDNTLVETDYTIMFEKYCFYNDTRNYDIVLGNRFGNLNMTPVDDVKISLVGYNKLNELKNIDIVKETNRIKVTNDSGDDVYLILDKFMDKRIYKISDLKYVNISGLNGKYTVFIKINDKVYKTDYYIEV